MTKRRTVKSFDSAGKVQEKFSEDEQKRIIRESGVLKMIGQQLDSRDSDMDYDSPILDTILFVTPFSFLYLMMDMLAHMQYGQHPSVQEYGQRVLSAIPVLFILIYNINPRKSQKLVQLGLFVSSLCLGMRLIWIVNFAPWYVIMRQGPPLATLWVYVIAILDLAAAVGSLALIGVWLWWFGLKLLL